MPTETIGVNVIADAPGIVRSGANQGALLAPLDANATISANVVKKYRRVSDAEADHFAGSLIADGVDAALNAGLPTVFAVGVTENTASESFTTETGTLGGTLLTNGGFETYTTSPGAPDSWTDDSGGSATLTQETTNVRSGSSAVKIEAGGTPTTTEGISQAITTTAGQNTTVTVWARTDGTTGEQALLEVFNSTDSTVTVSDTGTDATTTYEKLEVSFVPEEGKSYTVRLHHAGTPAATEVVYFDDSIAVGTANLPITEVTSASLTGDATDPADVTYTVVYTTEDPITTSPGTDEILVNTKTGDFSADTSSLAGGENISSIDIDFTYHDWDSALNVLDLEEYEYHTLAGFTMKDQYFGIWDNLLTHASDENKMVAAAYDTGVDAADVEDLTETIHSSNGDRLYLVAAHYTGDLTSGIMANRAAANVAGTAKEQVAPRSITFDDSYTISDFGGEESPVQGTFHEFGANAVFKDKGGTFRLTNDRAASSLTDFYRFHSTRRSVRFAENRIEEDLIALRRGSGTAIPFTETGLAAVRATISSSLGFLRDQGIIDTGTVTVPRIGEIDATDKQNRILDFVEVSVVLTGQVHFIDLDLKVEV